MMNLMKMSMIMNGHNNDNTEASAAVVSTAADNNNGLPRRRIIVGASPSLLPTKQSKQNNVSYKNNNNCNGQAADDQKKFRIQHNLQRHQRRILLYCQKSKWVILILSTAALLFSMTLLYAYIIKPMLDEENLTPVSFLRCSSLLHPRKPKSTMKQHQHQIESTNNIILTASHLRHGSDGQMRLRIIEHNLYYLLNSFHSDSSDSSSSSSSSTNIHSQTQFKSILIFSLDEKYQVEIKSMVNEWLHQLHPSISQTIIQQQQQEENESNNNILYVPNDAILVDAYKWITAIETIPNLLYTIRNVPNTRVMLVNDSFLLTRPIPELFTKSCGEVCGLGWTAPKFDPTRHFQSYIRTLSSCSIERYINFYYKVREGVHNVNELIVLFEIHLDWATSRRRGGGRRRKRLRGEEEGDVSEEEEDDDDDSISAMYEYVGAHPDEDDAQKILIPQGYPAIKLKKFFVTDDPWLNQNETTRPQLPPSFSTSIYKAMNHDLNHLSESDLEKHFKEDGYREDRIYSTLPLVIKDWLREELMKNEGGNNNNEYSTIDILEDYLVALNSAIAKHRE